MIRKNLPGSLGQRSNEQSFYLSQDQQKRPSTPARTAYGSGKQNPKTLPLLTTALLIDILKTLFCKCQFYTWNDSSVSTTTEAAATATTPGELPWGDKRRLASRSRAKEIDSRSAMH
ncbi:hypothetical protein [Citrifermentans bremense]|uniref:hypothetical protein n=1 Tax=Citrifermentans bremense TaxID=60035 RepID=UPI0012EBC02A|nr:hypothetical protein [Citrifermentans bremense]